MFYWGLVNQARKMLVLVVVTFAVSAARFMLLVLCFFVLLWMVAVTRPYLYRSSEMVEFVSLLALGVLSLVGLAPNGAGIFAWLSWTCLGLFVLALAAVLRRRRAIDTGIKRKEPEHFEVAASNLALNELHGDTNDTTTELSAFMQSEQQPAPKDDSPPAEHNTEAEQSLKSSSSSGSSSSRSISSSTIDMGNLKDTISLGDMEANQTQI